MFGRLDFADAEEKGVQVTASLRVHEKPHVLTNSRTDGQPLQPLLPKFLLMADFSCRRCIALQDMKT